MRSTPDLDSTISSLPKQLKGCAAWVAGHYYFPSPASLKATAGRVNAGVAQWERHSLTRRPSRVRASSPADPCTSSKQYDAPGGRALPQLRGRTRDFLPRFRPAAEMLGEELFNPAEETDLF